MTDATHPTRAVFPLRIAGKPGTAGIHALRFLLKRLLRQYGFVALDVRKDGAGAHYIHASFHLASLRRAAKARGAHFAAP